MYTTIDGFLQHWSSESTSTQRVLDGLTDASLMQESHSGGRTIGRLAWHIAQTIPEMMGRARLSIAGPDEHAPVPTHAALIASVYRIAADSLQAHVQQQWNDRSLLDTDDMYGEQWTRAQTLTVLVSHQIHHRGQLTVLMRQAGLVVPGMYGPVREDWAQMGMTPPEI